MPRGTLANAQREDRITREPTSKQRENYNEKWKQYPVASRNTKDARVEKEQPKSWDINLWVNLVLMLWVINPLFVKCEEINWVRINELMTSEEQGTLIIVLWRQEVSNENISLSLPADYERQRWEVGANEMEYHETPWAFSPLTLWETWITQYSTAVVHLLLIAVFYCFV